MKGLLDFMRRFSPETDASVSSPAGANLASREPKLGIHFYIMPFTDAELNRALAEWQEFGPRRRIPVEQRWPELFPQASPDDFAEARLRCQEIESFAVDLAGQVLKNRLSAHEAFRTLCRQYPHLTEESLDRTWSQAMYFASK